MKEMLLIYENPGTREAFFADEKLRAEMSAYVDGLRASGELVDGEGLADPSTARVVRFEHGVPAVTDGPFMEAKEYFGGNRMGAGGGGGGAGGAAPDPPPLPGGGAMEIRPLMSDGGSED